MLKYAAIIASALALTLSGTPAVAGPPAHANKAAKHGHKNAHKATRHLRVGGGPPPWAPAHGYRAKAGYYDNLAYRDYGLKAPPIDLSAGRCNKEILGQVLGGGLGALAGSQIGSGSGRLVAVASGTIIGVLVGGEIGRSMDRTDALCVDQALENAPDGETIVWNTDRQSYSITPTKTVAVDDGRYCREYTSEATINGRPSRTYGTACRQPDGSWKIVDQRG